MRLFVDLVRGLAESIRETLPRTEDECGPFLAGMCWAFVLFWIMVFVVTWLTLLPGGTR